MNGNGFFHDTDGGSSMMRLITFVVVIAIILMWAVMCLLKSELLDIPSGVLGVLITAMTGKLLQKGVEIYGANKADGEPK